MAASGFRSDPKKQKLNTEKTSQVTIKNAVFGDALVCLKKAIDRLEMKVEEVAMIVKGMMGPEEIPFIHYDAEGIDIPYGAYRVEGLGKITPADSQHIVPELILSIAFEKGADEEIWKKLIAIVNEELTLHTSMFRRKALKIVRPSDMIVPTYIDLTKKIPLFLNKDTEIDVDTNIFYPITNAVKLKEIGIGGARGVLLHGRYGTGKTLIAYECAQRSIETDRTFILCNIQMITSAIQVARFMEPATLFVEDMDSMNVSGSGLSNLRNTLSGVESKKGFDVIVILTTNLLSEVEQMDRSLLRPDRIDAIVEVPPPDLETTQRIVEHHGKGWLDIRRDYNDIYTQAAGSSCTPAILVEVLKRSKIVAMKSKGIITPEVMAHQLDKMSRQIELSEPKKPKPDDLAARFAQAMKEVAYEGNVGD